MEDGVCFVRMAKEKSVILERPDLPHQPTEIRGDGLLLMTQFKVSSADGGTRRDEAFKCRHCGCWY